LCRHVKKKKKTHPIGRYTCLGNGYFSVLSSYGGGSQNPIFLKKKKRKKKKPRSGGLNWIFLIIYNKIRPSNSNKINIVFTNTTDAIDIKPCFVFEPAKFRNQDYKYFRIQGDG
jgi:hypothetical protein